MARVRRARSAAEKEARAMELVRAARGLLGARGFGGVSVQEIASEAGISKGAVFLYYTTKEALGLAVLGVLVEEWTGELEERLGRLAAPVTAATVAAAVRRSLEERDEMVGVLSQLRALEENGGDEAVGIFRERLRGCADRIGGELERLLPALAGGGGRETFLTLQALVIGARQVMGSDSAPAGIPGAVGRLLRLHLEGVQAVAETAGAG